MGVPPYVIRVCAIATTASVHSITPFGCDVCAVRERSFASLRMTTEPGGTIILSAERTLSGHQKSASERMRINLPWDLPAPFELQLRRAGRSCVGKSRVKLR